MFPNYDENNYYPMNENYRYNNQREYTQPNEDNSLYYSNNNSNQYNYYSNNNYNNYNQNVNYSNRNLNNINRDEYSYNSIETEKRHSIISKNTQSKAKEILSNKYISKVIVENIRQPKDIIYMLDNYLNENNDNTNYEHHIEKNKISFIFPQEDTAFKFTKLLNNIKNRNPVYSDMNVHLSLKPNNNYNKDDKNKKRGLSTDSIQRLFNGLGSKKYEKKHKVNTNLDLGVSSPFSYPNERKRQKNGNNKENSFDNKLKDYNKLPIRVLDTLYKPLQSPIFRKEVKDKWVCPSDFKI